MILLDTLAVKSFKGLRSVELRFPVDGAVLVEGLNEAGKSTLLESIYYALYGSPLVTETSHGGAEEAISHDADACEVRLTLLVSDTRLEIARSVRRGRPSQARLTLTRRDDEPEEIRGVRAVNARVVEELGGLDGDCFLNSCFVEQKKLGKLEDLTAERRRESLLRLLNLERLAQVEAGLRPTRADEQELALARGRAELADCQARLPRLRAAFAKAEQALLALDIRHDLESLTDREAALRSAARERTAAQERVDAVDGLRVRVSVLEAEREAKGLVDALNELEPRLRAVERRLAAARDSSRRFQTADALAHWVRLRRSVALREHGERELQEAGARAARRAEEFASASTALRRRRTTAALAGSAGLAALVICAFGAWVGALWLCLLGAASATLLGSLAWRESVAARSAALAAKVAESALTEARVHEQTIHGQRVAAFLLGGGADDLARCESTLVALGEAVPADEERARERHAEIERRLVRLDRSAVMAAEREAERSLEQLRIERERLASRIALLHAGRERLGAEELAALEASCHADARALAIDLDGQVESAGGSGRLALLSEVASSARMDLGKGIERERNADEGCRRLRAAIRASLVALAPSAEEWAGELSSGAVCAAFAEVAEAEALAPADARERRDELRGELASAERDAVRLAAALGLDAIHPEASLLDAVECRAEVARLERHAQVKRRAADIVAEARLRIVARVLPNTERNFRMLLPRLTAGRYRDARIADDYRIEVWDGLAGRYVAKAIYSGGARDQFSLALRLAFALATLPEELGTSPGFLLLDEPLSSFDGQRTQALVELLTRGEIAASFRQIVVISHSRSFDASAFRYRLVLDGGAIVESNLPPLTTS